jgi:cell division protein ZapD
LPAEGKCLKIQGISAYSGCEPGSDNGAVVITYEYPLNERIRTLLRLEDLFARSGYFIRQPEPQDHHVALLTLFEIMEVASRADLKSDLLQELERQKQVLRAFRNNPEISEDALNHVLAEMEKASTALFGMTGRIGQYLRENEWLMSIKQRTGIPGGACQFDLPSYHYWLHKSSEERGRQLAEWTSPLHPLRDGSAIILKILRDSGKPAEFIAPQGIYQQMLGGKTAQMLRVRLDDALSCVPEMSANKYVLNIRFLTQGGEDPRPRTAEGDIGFELTFCNL